MRTVVIGDVHGCHRELIELLSGLTDTGLYIPNEDRLIFLGDYIDRGSNSRDVVRLVRRLQDEYPNVIALMGNHEDMLIQYKENRNTSWFYNGGLATLESYQTHEEEFQDDLEWFRQLPLYYEDDHFIYVHAGIDVNLDMQHQDRHTLLWVRDDFLANAAPYEKRVIFGHTPTRYLNGSNTPFATEDGHINIDTGCVFNGKLTALVIEDGKITNYSQVDKAE